MRRVILKLPKQPKKAVYMDDNGILDVDAYKNRRFEWREDFKEMKQRILKYKEKSQMHGC